MTINEALNILWDNLDNYDTYEWAKAWTHVVDELGVFWDGETEQWVTTDTGDVI